MVRKGLLGERLCAVGRIGADEERTDADGQGKREGEGEGARGRGRVGVREVV